MQQKSHYPHVRPATDIVDMENGVQITANMPGVNLQDLQVSLEGNNLHISASSHCPVPSEEKDVQTLEFGNVEFSLDIILNGVLTAPIDATLDKGVLSVFLPRTAGLSNPPVFLDLP